MTRFAYEELPEGVKVMLRDDDGTAVIVVNSLLSRVERLRAKEAGKQMLRHRRRHMLLPAGLAEDWAQRLREWAPVCRAPAAAVAGGALAMTVAVGSGVVDDRRQRQPWYAAQGPSATRAERFEPVRPVTSSPAPAPDGVTPAQAASADPPAGAHPAARPAGREPEPSKTETGEPPATRSDTPRVRERERVRSRPVHEPIVTKKSTVPTGEPERGADSPPPASSEPTPETQAPDPEPSTSTRPRVKVEVELPNVRPSSVGDTVKDVLEKPVGVGACDGLVDVDVKLLPKVCVGG